MKTTEFPFRLISVCLILLLSVGCEEDPEICPVLVAPYPVVHCILNNRDSVHYVRLTKLLSGSSDPYEIAQNRDNFYFKDAQVYFEEWSFSNGVIKTIQLEPTFEVPKDKGFFNFDYPLLYKTTEKLPGVLRLRIEIPEINTTVIGYGSTPGPWSLTEPDPALKRVLSFYENSPITIQWGYSGQEYYQTIIRFKYLESTETAADTCYVDWARLDNEFKITGEAYLEYLANRIVVNNRVQYRKVLGIDMILNYGTAGLKKYYAENDWMFDIIKEPYTNLYNAYGIIAGISTNTIGFQPNQKFLDSLANSSLTKDLKFVVW